MKERNYLNAPSVKANFLQGLSISGKMYLNKKSTLVQRNHLNAFIVKTNLAKLKALNIRVSILSVSVSAYSLYFLWPINRYRPIVKNALSVIL